MNAEPDKPEPDKPARQCPICKAPTQKKFTPFCSKRCADIDLGRWLNGVYVIEGSDSPSAETDTDESPRSDEF